MAIASNFQIEVCNWANDDDRAALLAVRDAVFIREQRVPRELERDADDAHSLHVLARNSDGEPIGTARLTPDPAAASPGSTRSGRIGRMAVLPAWRHHTIGSMLLNTLLELARARHWDSVRLHAQHAAIGFYQRHGFQPEGSEFTEAGIQHQAMQRPLDPLPAPSARPLAPLPQAVRLRADTREELIITTHTLIAGARHGLCMLVNALDPDLLHDTASWVELRRIALSGRGAAIRILAQDLTRALAEGTRVLELARQLPSIVQLRRPTERSDCAYPSAFLCVDTQGYLFRVHAQELGCAGSTYAPGRHAQLMALFDAVWARSEPWPEMRLLKL